MLEIIPAKPTEDLYDDNVHRRVAVYTRVSTGDPRQTSSYELQKNYYEHFISRYPNWELVPYWVFCKMKGIAVRFWRIKPIRPITWIIK